jgi:hypothetical protein
VVSQQKHLRRLAGDEPERRDVPDGVAGKKRLERIEQPQAAGHGRAQSPGFRPDHESQSAQREDWTKAPSHAANRIENLADARASDGVCEEENATERRRCGQNQATTRRAHRVNFQLPTFLR